MAGAAGKKHVSLYARCAAAGRRTTGHLHTYHTCVGVWRCARLSPQRRERLCRGPAPPRDGVTRFRTDAPRSGPRSSLRLSSPLRLRRDLFSDVVALRVPRGRAGKGWWGGCGGHGKWISTRGRVGEGVPQLILSVICRSTWTYLGCVWGWKEVSESAHVMEWSFPGGCE
eukprot:1417761-Prymnesium_polylepis.2